MSENLSIKRRNGDTKQALKENISFDSGKEQFIGYWIRRLTLHELIESLPENIDYKVSEKATNLSGGEKQRLAEIRAFVKDADVLIMNEPNSALASESLLLLCEILQEIKKLFP